MVLVPWHGEEETIWKWVRKYMEGGHSCCRSTHHRTKCRLIFFLTNNSSLFIYTPSSPVYEAAAKETWANKFHLVSGPKRKNQTHLESYLCGDPLVPNTWFHHFWLTLINNRGIAVAQGCPGISEPSLGSLPLGQKFPPSFMGLIQLEKKKTSEELRCTNPINVQEEGSWNRNLC